MYKKLTLKDIAAGIAFGASFVAVVAYAIAYDIAAPTKTEK